MNHGSLSCYLAASAAKMCQEGKSKLVLWGKVDAKQAHFSKRFVEQWKVAQKALG